MRRAIKIERFLARLPLFEGMGEAPLARLAAATTRRELARGEVLFREGEPSGALHALVYGSMKVTMRGAGGERVLDIIGPGRSFAEPVMFMGKPYIATASALSDCLVLSVSREAIVEELETNPAFARRVIAALAQRVEALVREVDSYALGSGAKRFVAWLLRRELQAQDGQATLMLPATKSAIASQLNLSAEHLSRILRELAVRGLIEMKGRVVRIPDLERLRAWSELPG